MTLTLSGLRDPGPVPEDGAVAGPRAGEPRRRVFTAKYKAATARTSPHAALVGAVEVTQRDGLATISVVGDGYLEAAARQIRATDRHDLSERGRG